LYGPRGQRSAAGHHAAKREAEQAQIRTVVSISRPLDYGERIFYFADTIGIVTLARADTAKVESHGRDPEIIHGAGQCIHDLIQHRALEPRMRVAQNSDQRSPEFFRFLEQSLQLASRARDIQRLFDRLSISHDASFYVPFIGFAKPSRFGHLHLAAGQGYIIVTLVIESLMNKFIEGENTFGARNYAPLPVVLTRGEGCHVWDTDGNRYLDMMSAYSAVSHGHAHPKLVQVMRAQSGRLSVVSRAFYTDQLAPFLEKACGLARMDRALPMNTGVEAVETALKAARRWAYEVKGIADDAAEIIVCRGNFHGRTIAAVAMSSETQYRRHFGPFPPGFRSIDYADVQALEAAINPNTAAFVVEPIQGEGGINVPPNGYLAACETICRNNNVLLICDEIQTGLGRTGKFLAGEHDDVHPDIVVLGKALGGGLYPVSLMLARREIVDLFEPGDHGSTFGGNPLAAAIGLAALNVLIDEKLIENSEAMGRRLNKGLRELASPLIKEVRGKGLLIGMEIDSQGPDARTVCERLMEHGILTKETHETVVRIAPPLIIDRGTVDWAIETIGKTLKGLTD